MIANVMKDTMVLLGKKFVNLVLYIMTYVWHVNIMNVLNVKLIMKSINIIHINVSPFPVLYKNKIDMICVIPVYILILECIQIVYVKIISIVLQVMGNVTKIVVTNAEGLLVKILMEPVIRVIIIQET